MGEKYLVIETEGMVSWTCRLKLELFPVCHASSPPNSKLHFVLELVGLFERRRQFRHCRTKFLFETEQIHLDTAHRRRAEIPKPKHPSLESIKIVIKKYSSEPSPEGFVPGNLTLSSLKQRKNSTFGPVICLLL